MAKKDTSKKAVSKAAKPAKQKKPSRIKQIGESYRLTKKTDPRIGLILLGVFLAAGVLAGGVAYLVAGILVYSIILGVMVGLLAALIIFGRRAQSSAISQIEGKPGAAASVLGLLRRGWKVEPGIAFNRQQDVAHRLVGPPGIVLIGEGNPNRLRQLLTSERRKHERVVSEATITEIVVGNDEGQVPLAKLRTTLMKLPRTITGKDVNALDTRLTALAARTNLPKGAIPKNMRPPKGAFRMSRGR